MKTLVFIIYLFAFCFLISCEGVEDLINAGKEPEIDERGIVLSAENVYPRDTVTASVSATNPLDGPLNYEWSATGGNFIQPADKDTVRWIAPLAGNTYRITVEVSNEKKSAGAYKDVTVISLAKPLVDIMSPERDSHFILGKTIAVRAHAEHENGIKTVRLFVGDSLIAEKDGHSGTEYSFDELQASPGMVGKAKIIVRAVALNQLTEEDDVEINVEGIILGK